jgi:4-amino-4-deoxy-L-arabinose transferase-like glycosyltransferase
VGGSLALPAIYWLGREIGSARRALVAMAILAFASWPLVFSRWAWTGALMLPLVLAAAACALRALRTGRVPPAFAAGVLVGLSLHTHPAAWAAAAGLGAFGLTVMRPHRAGRLLGVAALGGLIAFLPFGVAFLKFPDRVGGRARDVSYIGGSTKDVAIPGRAGPFAQPLFLLYNTIEYTGIFLWTHDPNPRHGLPDRPPVDPVLGLASLAGAAVALRRARSRGEGERLVLYVVGATLFAGLLANPGGAPNLSRVYPLVAAPALWAATALVRWIPVASRAFAARRWLAWTFALVLLLVLETRVFLVAWPSDPRVVGSFCVAETDAGRTASVLGTAPIVLAPKALSWPIVFETLAAGGDPRRPVARVSRRTAEDLLRSPPDRPFWFVSRDADLEPLRRASWQCPLRRNGVGDADRVRIARVVPRAE